jgi:hypothetical protein
MTMQGKSAPAELPSLDIAEAEHAATAIRPSWDVEEPTVNVSVPTVRAFAPMTSEPAVVASPVIAVGTAPEPPAPAPAPAPAAPAAPKPAVSTQLGISPAAAAVVAAANAAARAPAPSAEAIDSANVIEVVPPAPETAPLPSSSVAANAVTLASAMKAELSPTGASAGGGAKEPLAVAAPDPFRNVPAAPKSEDDLAFVVKKRSPKTMIFGAIGVVTILGAGLVWKLASAPNAPPARPSTSAAVGPAVPTPTDDIPPPPPKEEEPAPKAAAAPTPPPAPEPPAPAPTHAPTHAHAAKTPEPPPRPVAAAPAPRPRATPVPAPKSPPKSVGGGIVRDSPF